METTTWTFDFHVIRSCSLKPRQICEPAGVKQTKSFFSTFESQRISGKQNSLFPAGQSFSASWSIKLIIAILCYGKLETLNWWLTQPATSLQLFHSDSEQSFVFHNGVRYVFSYCTNIEVTLKGIKLHHEPQGNFEQDEALGCFTDSCRYLISHVSAHSRRHFCILSDGSPVTNSRHWSFRHSLLAAQYKVQQEPVSITTHNKKSVRTWIKSIILARPG